MVKLQFNGGQYTVTIGVDHIKRMGWAKGTELYVAKDPDRNLLYIEEAKEPIKHRRKGGV